MNDAASDRVWPKITIRSAAMSKGGKATVVSTFAIVLVVVWGFLGSGQGSASGQPLRSTTLASQDSAVPETVFVSFRDDDENDLPAPVVGPLHIKSAEKLKQIALATHYHHDAHGCFPAGYSADSSGGALLSWRVHVLPYMQLGELHDRFHLDEPWDSPHNKKLVPLMPDVYRSPRSKGTGGKTNYLGVAGGDGVFVRPKPGDRQGSSIRHVRDGTSNTVLVIEVSDNSAIEWSKPGDFAPTADWLKRLEVGRFQVVFADGRARFFPDAVKPRNLRAMFTKAGMEPLDRRGEELIGGR